MKNYRDFLLSENFIKWRLFRTKEQDEQWEKSRLENPDFEQPLNEAIRKFDALEMNRKFLSKNEKDAIYFTVMQNIRKHKKRKLQIQIWLTSTAAILAIAFLSAWFIQLNRNNASVLPIENKGITGQTLPGEDIYIVSGGEKINITNQSDILLEKDGKVLVVNNKDAKEELIFNAAKMNKLVVPFGKQSTLMLADGTKIYLNSGTQVDFPSEFNGKTREIHVDGEIFIEVTKDTKKPFIVHTDRMGYPGTRYIIQCLGLSQRCG